MSKIKKTIIVLIVLILCMPTCLFAQEPEEEYEELDYVWLKEELISAKEQSEPKINSKCAVVYDRASNTVIWGKNEDTEVPMASTTNLITT